MAREQTKSTLGGRLREFFFAEQSPYGMALVRMFLPSVAMIPMVRRFPHVRELFSSEGTPQPLFELFGQTNPFPLLSPPLAASLYGLMMFGMLCVVLGWRTRLSLCVAVPLYIYFNLLDSVGTMTKYTVIASHILLLLTLSNCGAVWSVDALLKKRTLGQNATAIPPVFPVWPARLTQFLFCFIYFGAAITKIQTESFFTGEQMRYWMLSNWNYSNPVGEQMAMWTPLLLAGAYFTVVWEIVFAFLVWRPGSRLIMLGLGAFFHFMTWLTLGLYIFPLICLSGYLSYVTESDIVRIRRLIRRVKLPTKWLAYPRELVVRAVEARPASVPVLASYLVVAALSAVSAAEVEYRLDAYGLLANNGPLPLKTVDSQVALAMIRDKTPVREKDKYFSFEIGKHLLGGQLADRCSEYEFGDVVVAQCNLNPPHEDLWVECLLQDEQKRTFEQSGQFVTRDMLYANFYYHFGNALVPGKYFVVLRSSGKEIYRRTLYLRGDPASVPEMNEMMTN